MNANILVADADADVRHLAATTLRRHGYHVSESAVGDDALAAIAQHAPDLLLLDEVLTDGSGQSVAQVLGGQPTTKLLPTILLVGKTHEGELRAWLRGGVRGYLIKPFRPHDLVERVDQMLRAVQGQ